MDNNVMFKIGYGLYVLSARLDGYDNGCIINTFMQTAENPNKVVCAVNKANYTCEMIRKSGEFNVSLLDESADFSLFKRFGYQSGRDTDKFKDFDKTERSKNGLIYISCHTNSYISCRVISENDMGSHILFTAQVTDAVMLQDTRSLSYDYYQNNIKPGRSSEEQKKTGWICKICGYIYEGEELPADYICPICKHGASDFEKLQ